MGGPGLPDAFRQVGAKVGEIIGEVGHVLGGPTHMTGRDHQYERGSDERADDNVEQPRHAVLEVLVNNVWGGYEDSQCRPLRVPFWEQSLTQWDRMFTAGVRAHLSRAGWPCP